MCQPLNEMGCEPEVIRAHLPRIFPFAERRIGEGLTVGVHELVPFEFVIEPEGVRQRQRMLEPERVVGYSFDFVRGLQYPTFPPGIDDPIFVRSSCYEFEWNLKYDRVYILARLAIDAAVDKTVITVRILTKCISRPGERPRWEVFLHPVISPFRKLRIVVEKIVTLEFKKRFRDLQLASFRHGMGYVVELGSVVDRSKKSGQIVEECIVSTTYVGLYGGTIWRVDYDLFIGLECLYESAPREVDEPDCGVV